jgi:acyl transferase domain-containing protein/acyl carrier protein/2-polyprenyl-3-methyl-5-hydroxy-6-metoxy-1,4-benzoquinol methylase
VEKSTWNLTPLAPFPTREGGKFKASPLVGERFGERFSRSRKKSDKHSKSSLLSLLLALPESIAVNLKTYLLHTKYSQMTPSHTNGSEIAIIGIAGQFPQAKNINQFWENLKNGVESISFFTDEELLSTGIYSKQTLNDPNLIKARAVLENIEFFDAEFFGFSPREAEITDPQHRLFLECAWQALENAGYDSESYAGSIGVYGGASLNDYLLNIYSQQKHLHNLEGNLLAIANEKDYLTTRVSYKLNLEGPSITLQTACSSSLIAVHFASQSLLNGECDMALAGGVCISSARKSGYFYTEGGIGSKDGHCRAFDASAGGTVGGEGVGIVVLKRLADAIADGDTVHALIKGSAVNNDGSSKVSYMAPRIDGQAKVIQMAQLMAEVEPETITYIEAHGTGTNLGDPMEIAALTQTFRTNTDKKGFCAIGSLKTNIGHLDAAAGIAGLIKTVLALKHKQIPPSLHFEEPNPQIDFATSPFFVNNILQEWQVNGIPRRAGVSSFGIGGTNAHVILEEAPIVENFQHSRPWQLLLLSAKTGTALETATSNLREYLQEHPNLHQADIAYTLQLGRRAFDYRRILVCEDLADAVKVLTSEPQRILTQHHKPSHRSVVFMFSPQGSQYVNMGRELYQTEALFHEQVDYCSELLKPHLGLDLRDILYPSPDQIETASQNINQTAITQPALFVVEYALARLWMAWGIHPEAIIGHSIGEYVAATLAGVFSLEDALVLVATRGKLMQQLPTGAMLSVQLSKSEVEPLLGEELALAGSNSPSACVVSGTTEAVDELQQKLQQQGVNCRRLHTSHAFHSQMMEPIIEPFTAQLRTITLKSPKIPFISNLSGTWITPEAAINPSYWAKHLRQAVLFNEGIAELLKQPDRIFLEVGPSRSLCTFVKQQTSELLALNSLRHPQEQNSDVAFLLNTLGRLWLTGVKVNWHGFYAEEKRQHIPLPTYPFERQRYWIDLQPNSAFTLNDLNRIELWQSLLEAGRQANSNFQLDVATYLANKQCLDNLCLAYINLALRGLGAFNKDSDRYSLDELYEHRIIPRYQQLLCRWLDVLVESGHLQQQQGLFTNLVACSPESKNGLLQQAKIRWAENPQTVDIVEECGENLAAVIVGEKEPLSLYLAAGEKHPNSNNSSLPLDICLKNIIRAGVEQIVNFLPANTKLRILEIGGGQGIVTTELLPVLPARETSYTFTDVGGLFVNQAQQKFSAYPFVEYRLLNIEKSPIEQGFSPHSFDVAIAVNVLHVTDNIDETLEHVRSLLAPGGFLLLWEITQPQLDFDITDALLMNPLTNPERSRGNPFLSQIQWQEALKSHGFIEVNAFAETEAFGEQILVSQATTSGNQDVPAAFTVTLEAKSNNQIQQNYLEKKPDIADWFYIPNWKRSLLNKNVRQAKPGCWLLFVDECGLGEKLAREAKLQGEDVITVQIGQDFSSDSNSGLTVYTINPQQKHDYYALIAELRRLGKFPKKVIHLWSVTLYTQSETNIDIEQKYEEGRSLYMGIGTPTQNGQPVEVGVLNPLLANETLGFYSLLYLTQAIAEKNLTETINFEIISSDMQQVTGAEILCPEKALILGLSRTIALEYPQITCRSIDVVLPPSESWREKQLLDQLLVEINTPVNHQCVAYRGHYRWIQDFEAVELQTTATTDSPLKEGGVYLITGGLGGVGLALGEYLAQSVKAKLVLIGRSHFPERHEWEKWLDNHEQQDSISTKIRKLLAMEVLGTEVMILKADVADFEQMSAAVHQARQRFGEIHGVIHAAGVPGGGMIQLKTQTDVASALAPKVKGTRVLEALFQNTNLDFLILCSSLSSYLGASGIVDYTAENAFLDAFAHYYAAKTGKYTLAINWDRWKGLGMAAAVESRHKAITGENLAGGMTTSEGVEAFKRILDCSVVPQILVSTQDFLSLMQTNNIAQSWEKELTQLSQFKPAYPRPNLGNAYIAPRNEIEQTLADVWQQLLGIDKIGIYDNFFELGGDSLFATQLVSHLCKTFQIELPYKSFFNAPTIAELATIIVEDLTAKTGESLSEILSEIEQLSEAEIQAIFAAQN